MPRALVVLLVLGAAACGSVLKPSDANEVSSDDGSAKTSHSCADLPTLHTAALATARSCDPSGGSAQCQSSVRLDLLCGCMTYVNDATTVNALYAEWQAQDCPATPPYQMSGCVTGCLVEAPRTCVAVDGGGVCEERNER